MFGFMRRSVYDDLASKVSKVEYDLSESKIEAKALRKLWYGAADLADKYKNKIHALASENYRLEAHLFALQRSKAAPDTMFTQDELRSLLQLVHPDKHEGKESAVRLTQKINELRK